MTFGSEGNIVYHKRTLKDEHVTELFLLVKHASLLFCKVMANLHCGKNVSGF
jgi:hypothetical protein